MKWLSRLIGGGLEAAGLDVSGRIGGSIQFFIYDTIKIMVLLGFLIYIISYIQSYFPPERTKKILGRFRGIWANMIAALLGTVTPLLFLLIHTIIYGVFQCGTPLGCYIFFPHFLSHGGFRFACAPYEHFWMESGCCVCGDGPCDCGCRWNTN